MMIWKPFAVLALIGAPSVAAAQTAVAPSPPSPPVKVDPVPPEMLATRTAPRGSPSSWISAVDDYPSTPIRRNDSGTTEALLTVDATGRVNQCQIVKSSGSELLDSQTCRLLKRRARFNPATDRQGQPAADTWLYRIEWPSPEAPATA